MKKKINGQKEFREYLGEIPLDNNPFSCPNLRVLQEEVNFCDNIILGSDYPKGTLICKESSEMEPYALLHHECYIIGKMQKVGDKVNIHCNYGKTLEIEVKNVRF